MYLYIVLDRYLFILGAPSVKSGCTLSISASYRVVLAINFPNVLHVNSSVSLCCPQFVPANASKTLFLLLTLLATGTQ